MTSEERKRAKKLDLLSRRYVWVISQKTVLKILLIVMGLYYLIIFGTASEYIYASHVFVFSLMFFCYTVDIVGDNEFLTYSDMGALPLNGKSGTGAFLCTLPFKAKDILAVRLRKFEINLAATNIMTAAVQIVMLRINADGLRTSGLCIAVLLLSELGYLAVTFIRGHYAKFYSSLFVLCFSIIVSNYGFGLNKEMFPLLDAFGFLSGWGGAAALIIFPILLSVGGELHLKNNKSVSWHLR